MIVLPVLKSLEEKLHILVQDREYIKHDQMEVLEMKTLMPEMNVTVDGIISRFNSAEEKISIHEEIAIEIIQNEAQREKKRWQKMNNQGIVEQFQNWPSKCVAVFPKGEEK